MEHANTPVSAEPRFGLPPTVNHYDLQGDIEFQTLHGLFPFSLLHYYIVLPASRPIIRASQAYGGAGRPCHNCTK
jgi:hypothetical protein